MTGSFNPATGEGVTAEWYTPPEIFHALGLEFDLDPASPAGGVPWVPATRFISAEEDGLATSWVGRVWLNPPYGRGIARWVDKMLEHRDGVLLTFARTDTRWWQHAARAADAICFLSGRVVFIPGSERAPGKRSPTDRPGASSTLFAYGAVCARALEHSGLGLVAQARGAA